MCVYFVWCFISKLDFDVLMSVMLPLSYNCVVILLGDYISLQSFSQSVNQTEILNVTRIATVIAESMITLLVISDNVVWKWLLKQECL